MSPKTRNIYLESKKKTNTFFFLNGNIREKKCRHSIEAGSSTQFSTFRTSEKVRKEGGENWKNNELSKQTKNFPSEESKALS